MLFYQVSSSPTPPSPGAPDAQSVASGSLSRGSPQSKTWALRSLATGVSILGLAYCLVQVLQVAGAQYLATLTTVSLLASLFVYLMWCAAGKKRPHDGMDSVVECDGVAPSQSVPAAPHGRASAAEMQNAELLMSLAAAGLYLGPAEAKRALTPPPSYEEAVRAKPPPPNLPHHLRLSTERPPPPPLSPQ